MAWVLRSLHSSFKKELLDEFLDGFLNDSWMNVNFKIAENSERKTVKENA